MPEKEKTSTDVIQEPLAENGKPLAPRKISQLAPINPEEYVWKKPADLAGIKLILTDFEIRDGQWGSYAWMNVTDPSTGETHEISYGGKMVVVQLLSLKGDQDLPCEIMFQEMNKSWYMV